MLASQLWGISDSDVVRDIERRCARRLGPARVSWESSLLAAIGATVGAVVGVGGAWASRRLGFGGQRCIAAVSIVTGTAIGCCLGYWQRRRACLRILPEVLASLGRCTNCGFDVATSDRTVCPECGTLREERI